MQKTREKGFDYLVWKESILANAYELSHRLPNACACPAYCSRLSAASVISPVLTDVSVQDEAVVVYFAVAHPGT